MDPAYQIIVYCSIVMSRMIKLFTAYYSLCLHSKYTLRLWQLFNTMQPNVVSERRRQLQRYLGADALARGYTRRDTHPYS